VSQLFLEFF